MIKILVFVAILCLAIFLGPYLTDSQGFVHIATDHYILNTSLTFAIIAIVIFAAIIALIIKLIAGVYKVPKLTLGFLSQRHKNKIKNLLEEAAIAYTEGNYLRAVSLIEKAGPKQSLPISIIFIMAKSAFNIGDTNKAKDYLDFVIKNHKDAKIAALVVKSQLNLKLDNVAAAKSYLDEIQGSYQSKFIKQLQYQCLVKKGDIEALYHDSAHFVAQKVISSQQQRQIYLDYINYKLSNAKTTFDLRAIYKKFSAADKIDTSIICPFIEKLVAIGDLSYAKKLTLKLLKENPSNEIYDCIAKWDMAVPGILEILEEKANENLIASQVNVPLLKALGNLELQEGKYVSAREHFEKALELSKTKELYLMLAKTLSMQQQYAKANEYFMLASKM